MSSSALRVQLETALSPRFGACLSLREKAVPAVVPSGIAGIDLPRATLTEIYGAPSSGRTGILLAALARATRLPECCALIDGTDSFDPLSGAEAGIDLRQLLWVRCRQNAEHALKAADLLVQAGGFGMIVLDLAGLAPRDTRRISLASWFRLRHTVEKTNTALVVTGDELIARSCSTLQVEAQRADIQVTSGLLRGITVEAALGPRQRTAARCAFHPVFRS